MICAIIPVKALALAKGRLSSILTAAERRALVLAMLGDVLAALGAARGVERVGVISADETVLALALALGAEALHDRAPDLNAALAQAAGHYADAGASAALVLPADVPLLTPGEIERLVATRAGASGGLIAPSRDGGTNALLIWPPLALPFLFGQQSLARHQAAAHARALALRTFHTPGLELDVDRPDDLLLLAEAAGATAAQRLVRALNLCERMACV
jgi:2-phospho-L-lactate guanylyltransferase